MWQYCTDSGVRIVYLLRARLAWRFALAVAVATRFELEPPAPEAVPARIPIPPPELGPTLFIEEGGPTLPPLPGAGGGAEGPTADKRLLLLG